MQWKAAKEELQEEEEEEPRSALELLEKRKQREIEVCLYFQFFLWLVTYQDLTCPIMSLLYFRIGMHSRLQVEWLKIMLIFNPLVVTGIWLAIIFSFGDFFFLFFFLISLHDNSHKSNFLILIVFWYIGGNV